MKKKLKGFIQAICPLWAILFLTGVAQAKQPALNEIAVEIPVEGGGMLMLSRQWAVNKYIRLGGVIGGGVIQRDLEFQSTALGDLDGETDALILPFIGPRVTFQFPIVAISLAYGAFYAKTDFDVTGSGIQSLSGEESGWGTGFYSPLLSLDFYSSKYDAAFGFGLGGFLGTTYPDLEATNSNTRVTSDESPLDALTIHLKLIWFSGRRERRREEF